MTDYTALPAAPAAVGTETSTPSPTPTDVLRPDLDPTDVTPGTIGFVMTFLLALAGVGVWFSMNRKIRRLGYEERAARDASGQSSDRPDDGPADPTDGPPRP